MALIERYWFRGLGTLGMSEDLNQLRSAIDNLDNEILQALAKRMKLSDQVIAAKNGAAAFRPGREAFLVRQLVINSKANCQDLSPEVILGVWRQIMDASPVLRAPNVFPNLSGCFLDAFVRSGGIEAMI